MTELSEEARRRFEGYARELAETGDAQRLGQMAAEVGLDQHLREHLRAADGARGTLEAFVVIRVLPRDEVRRMLPPGLELAPQPLTPPDGHLVFLVFGHERLDSWFGGTDFHGLTFGVPWVQHADPHVPHRGPFIYRPRQYVDRTLPRMIGSRVYGMERVAADIEADDDAYRIHAPHRRDMLVEGWFERRGDPAPPSSFAHFDDVRQIFDQPVVTQALRIVDEHAFHRRDGGPLLGCINRYLFDDPGASLTPVRAVVRVEGEVTPAALPRDRAVVGSIEEQPLGAFHLRVPQELSLPTQSVRLRFPEPQGQRRKRIVVLGGGPASCAAAFYLAKTGRYDVSMYTLGFRLGGKCAAGRNPDRAQRIEEHGLHAFLGFYNNAFRTLREVYEVAELPAARGPGPWSASRLRGGEGPFAEAFVGTNTVGLMGQWPDAEGQRHWSYYPTTSEINDSVPGVVPFGTHGPTGFARAMMVTLQEATRQARRLTKRDRGENPASSSEAELEGPGFFARLFGRVALPFGRDSESADEEDEVDDDDLGDEEQMLDIVEHARKHLERATFGELADAIASGSRWMRILSRVLVRLRDKARHTYAPKIVEEPRQWFEWSGLDVMLTIAIGLIAERATHFDQLDGVDLMAWLKQHGIAPGNERSPLVVYLYDSSFANSRTDPLVAGELAAGVGLRWFLLLLDYHGFQAYEFRHSCPQTLMSPYYRALTKLGVEINFFHKVEALEVEAEGGRRRLVGVRLLKQATVKAGSARYDPLWLPPIPNNPPDRPPWPDRPDYDQLEEGDRLREHDLEDAWTSWPGVGTVELRQGEDFDLCVCGMSLGALPPVTRALTDPDSPAYCEPWARMIEGMALTQTVSMQLWMERTEDQLYGDGTIPAELGLLTQFAPPEGSFGNFTHLLPYEDWARAPGIETPPGFLAYHTGALSSGHPLAGHPFTEHDYPERTQAAWRAQARDWLATHYRALYNRAPERFAEFCEQLVAPADMHGEDRLAYQYFNVGLQPWDLYVLSHPGTTTLRLGQSESWCDNLFLCGDWTRTDINAGCVEAATQSGMLCSRVISQHPRYVWHVGF